MSISNAPHSSSTQVSVYPCCSNSNVDVTQFTPVHSPNGVANQTNLKTSVDGVGWQVWRTKAPFYFDASFHEALPTCHTHQASNPEGWSLTPGVWESQDLAVEQILDHPEPHFEQGTQCELPSPLKQEILATKQDAQPSPQPKFHCADDEDPNIIPHSAPATEPTGMVAFPDHPSLYPNSYRDNSIGNNSLPPFMRHPTSTPDNILPLNVPIVSTRPPDQPPFPHPGVRFPFTPANGIFSHSIFPLQYGFDTASDRRPLHGGMGLQPEPGFHHHYHSPYISFHNPAAPLYPLTHGNFSSIPEAVFLAPTPLPNNMPVNVYHWPQLSSTLSNPPQAPLPSNFSHPSASPGLQNSHFSYSSPIATLPYPQPNVTGVSPMEFRAHTLQQPFPPSTRGSIMKLPEKFAPRNVNISSGRHDRASAQRQKSSVPRAPHSRLEALPMIRSAILEEFRANHDKKWNVEDILGCVSEFSQDQFGSRFVQQRIENAEEEEQQIIFKEIVAGNIIPLAQDVFGNYVIQKLLEYGTASQRFIIANNLLGSVSLLALHTYGCRVIQKAIEVVSADQQAKLVRELEPDILVCVKDVNGNHVIQKFIEVVPPKLLDFVSSFQGCILDLARHPYGCRVLQRCLQHLPENQIRSMVQELLTSTLDLMQDQFANYVIQHIIEHGPHHATTVVLSQLQGRLLQFAQHKYASNVCEKALISASSGIRQSLIGEILVLDNGYPRAIANMMQDQYANYVLQRAILVVEGHQRGALFAIVRYQISAFRQNANFCTKHLLSVERLLNKQSRNDASS